MAPPAPAPTPDIADDDPLWLAAADAASALADQHERDQAAAAARRRAAADAAQRERGAFAGLAPDFKAKRRRPDDRRASSASAPVKRRRESEAPDASPRRPRRSCTESSWGDAPDYGCAAYDDRVDAAVRAGAVLFPKRTW